MSDDITPELVENAKRRDQRLGLIGEWFAIEREMKESPTIRYLVRRMAADADVAMRELASISPSDVNAIQACLVKISAQVYMQALLRQIKHDAEFAAQTVREEDMMGFDVGDN